jgi:hypothetical protein
MRKNGFSLPFSRLQIFSWLVVSIMILSFYIFLLPAFSNKGKIITLIMFTLNTMLTIGITIKCTYIDPIDPAINSECIDESFVSKICTICRASVHENSKHCGECNKCVEYFDHHCKLLNNCIGKANYKYFIALVTSLETISLSYLVIVFYVIIQAANETQEHMRLKQFFNTNDEGIKSLVGLLVVTAFMGLVVFVFNSYLIGLHIWLRKNSLTTYQYILILRKRKAEVKTI